MLAEAFLLSGLGTVLGSALAWIGIHELLVIAPANLPRLDAIKIDPVVVIFTALAGLAAAAIFGVVPALRASRPDVMHVLRSSGGCCVPVVCSRFPSKPPRKPITCCSRIDAMPILSGISIDWPDKPISTKWRSILSS